MPKLYTKTGDKGLTSLYDGNRLPKGSVFFDVLGDIDELTSHIGMLSAMLAEQKTGDDYTFLRVIQTKLMDISSNIAVVDPGKKDTVPKLDTEDVYTIETLIDRFENATSLLTEFVLPGVTTADA